MYFTIVVLDRISLACLEKSLDQRRGGLIFKFILWFSNINPETTLARRRDISVMMMTSQVTGGIDIIKYSGVETSGKKRSLKMITD